MFKESWSEILTDGCTNIIVFSNDSWIVHHSFRSQSREDIQSFVIAALAYQPAWAFWHHFGKDEKIHEEDHLESDGEPPAELAGSIINELQAIFNPIGHDHPLEIDQLRFLSETKELLIRRCSV
jgi:hypothetical protein